jgi:type 1 glutamine amidotransferase
MLFRFLLLSALSAALLTAQGVTSEQRALIDEALPQAAPASPRQARVILVTNLQIRNGEPWEASSFAEVPAQNYAFEQMGKKTGAYEVVFNNDIEMFRPENLQRFDAVCFLNSNGVLFEDEELRRSLMSFIESGKGVIGIHDALATFVQYPVYDQWPEFGRMLGGTENGGHPWNTGELMTMKLDDPDSPLTAAFGGKSFQIADQAFQLQEASFRDRLHVLYSVDAVNTPPSARGRILPQRREDRDFPMAWVHRQGQGRVFFTGLGHTADVFWNPQFLAHVLAGVQYALGDLEADDGPDRP